MTTWLYVGTGDREFPGDGMWPSFVAHPGDTVEADENPSPLFFDQAGNTIPADPPKPEE